MTYAWPFFDRNGSLAGNYKSMLFCLDLLEDTEDIEDAIAAAETQLLSIIPSYQVGDQMIQVGPGKFKTAAFFYALSLAKGTKSFQMTEVDINRLSDYVTNTILQDAEANPGKHQVIDLTVLGREKPTIHIG